MSNSLIIYDQKLRSFNFCENFTGYQAPKVIFLFKLKKFILLSYGFKNPINMNSGMKNSFVIYDQKFRILIFADNFAGY